MWYLMSRSKGFWLPRQSVALSAASSLSPKCGARASDKGTGSYRMCVFGFAERGSDRIKHLMQTPWEASQRDVASEENTNSCWLCNLSLFQCMLHSGMGTLRTKHH